MLILDFSYPWDSLSPCPSFSTIISPPPYPVSCINNSLLVTIFNVISSGLLVLTPYTTYRVYATPHSIGLSFNLFGLCKLYLSRTKKNLLTSYLDVCSMVCDILELKFKARGWSMCSLRRRSIACKSRIYTYKVAAIRKGPSIFSRISLTSYQDAPFGFTAPKQCLILKFSFKNEN